MSSSRFSWARLARLPALRACAAQLLALALVLALAWFAERAGIVLALWQAALIQGLLAALLGAWLGLARWWWPIQLLFLPAALVVSALAVPPGVFLALFALLVLAYWSTFRTQVPYYPSSPAVWEAVAAALPQDRAVRVIDIGSGLGGMVMTLQAQRPESHFEGIELAPLPWLISRLRALLRGSTAQLRRGDYEALDFAQYDAVFAYLSPAAMERLWHKARREMRPGSMLFSYEFPIPGQLPNRTLLPGNGGSVVYLWDF